MREPGVFPVHAKFPRGKFCRLEFTGWTVSPGKNVGISPGKILQVRVYRLDGFPGGKNAEFPSLPRQHDLRREKPSPKSALKKSAKYAIIIG